MMHAQITEVQNVASAADRQLVVAEFDGAVFPGGAATLDTAWLGIYQVLWWYDSPLLPVRGLAAGAPAEIRAALDKVEAYLKATAGTGILHVREANDLRRPTWRLRAARADAYIASQLGADPSDLPVLFDRMMRTPRWAGMQRNNPLGNGLRMLIAEVAGRWGNPKLKYDEETKATDWFPGISLAGRSARPSIDVAITEGTRPRAVGSCKWSIRHDRISDPTNECTAYRSAAIQQQLMDLRYYVVTNELDGQRLDKILTQPCVSALVHVHLDLVRELGTETPRMRDERQAGRLLDLADWVRLTKTWA